jgi:lysophospholipase L1-like esterase
MGIRKHRWRPAAWIAGIAGIVIVGLMPCRGAAAAATIVALGASNTYGKGVSRSNAYPAQLEALLRAQGHAESLLPQVTGALGR